ncbi:MAG TPA: hypothetical protein VEY96_12120, partial [Actinomycetes bacterium]|nr:hypothetical protein [Actinomycetes bacterium]
VLLARAFRSLLLAFKAIVLNLLSIGAAYGVLVLVWQEGYGSEALWGIPATGAIAMWVPLMAFAFLYGLSWTTRSSCWPACARSTTTPGRPTRPSSRASAGSAAW